ncbi:protein Ves [mine drainage metagenome]|uniref:Protein Ves n=1 Tax=mine drainage metagenome TaxID=410659 RepID=A0A1J5PG54_9ZZZZ
MRHLTTSDYRKMPWANGLGVTTEILRVAKPDGGVLWRLSMAAVVEVGAFSLFPGIERNLTVIAGPGFDLVGPGLMLRADPLVPVAFPGDVAISAVGVSAPSNDFNVMTERSLPRPEVRVLRQSEALAPGGTLCLFALDAGKVQVAGTVVTVARHDLLVCDAGVGARNTGAAAVLATRLIL